MKIQFSIPTLILALMGITFSGCQKDPTPPALDLSRSSIEFTNEGYSAESVTVTSNTSWAVTGVDESWLKISSTSGNGDETITIEPKSSNNTSSSRSLTLTFTTVDAGTKGVKGDAVQKKITVTQGATYLNVSKTSLTFDHSEGSASFDVDGNTEWIVTGALSWVKVIPENGNGKATVTVQVSENTNTEDRSCNLEVRTKDSSFLQQVSITQKATPVSLSLSSSNIRIGGESGTTGEFTISCNSTWKLSYDASWLSVSATGGTGNSSVTITSLSDNFSDEERQTSITVSSGNKTETVKVVQEPELAANCRISLTDEIIMYDGIAGTIKFGSAAKGYVERYYTSRAADTYTERELFNDVKENGSRYAIDVNYFFSPVLDPATEYVYCVIAYNADGKLGPMKTTRFRTSATTASFDAPITSLYLSNNYWYTKVSMQQHCDRFYIYAFNNGSSLLTLPDAFIVYMYLKGFIENDPDDYYKRDDKYFTYKNAADNLLVFTWGVSDNTGEFSNELRFKYASASSSTPVIKAPSATLDQYNKKIPDVNLIKIKSLSE